MESPAERIQMTRQGRIVVPAAMRRELQLTEGQSLVARVVDGELRIAPMQRSIRKWQQYARELNPAGQSLVDELLAERRAEREA